MRDFAKRIPRRLEKQNTRRRGRAGGGGFCKVDNTRQTLQGSLGRSEKIPGVFGIFGGQKKMLGIFPRSAAVPLSNQC